MTGQDHSPGTPPVGGIAKPYGQGDKQKDKALSNAALMHKSSDGFERSVASTNTPVHLETYPY